MKATDRLQKFGFVRQVIKNGPDQLVSLYWVAKFLNVSDPLSLIRDFGYLYSGVRRDNKFTVYGRTGKNSFVQLRGKPEDIAEDLRKARLDVLGSGKGPEAFELALWVSAKWAADIIENELNFLEAVHEMIKSAKENRNASHTFANIAGRQDFVRARIEKTFRTRDLSIQDTPDGNKFTVVLKSAA